MPDFIRVILDFLTQFAGGRGGIDHNVVQFGLAATIWGSLLIIALERRREDNPARERLLSWGFGFGLGRELLMFGMAFIVALDLVDHDRLHIIFPPLEHTLANTAMFIVAGAFLLFLRQDQHQAKRYLQWSLASLALCYLATFWWWSVHIQAFPTSKFGQTWCDWLFRVNASIWLFTAIILVLRGQKGWLRNVITTALGLFFLTEFLKIPDMALGELYEHNFAPIRHSCYLLGVFLLGYVYLREQAIERKHTKAAILKLAYHDTLTALPNRALLQDRLGQILAQAERNEDQVALLFLDLDRFKAINDTHGHAMGDLLLKEVSGRLNSCLREGDTLARLGGDEFVITLPALQHSADALAVADKIMSIMKQPFDLKGHEVLSSTSIGIAFYPDDGTTIEDLLKHADMAMYAAKDEGRCRYRLFSQEMHHRIIERHTIETDLRRALEGDELFLCYQPQVEIKSGAVHGVEALLRWQHPVKGMIYPMQFIPVAEETDLITALGEWTLTTACRQGQFWREAGLSSFRIAINISATQFNHPGFLDFVDQTLEETGLPAEALEFELTERVLMMNADRTIDVLEALKERGIHLAIDDFGTGYSSLSYLKHFPIDRIKIDQSFVSELAANKDDAVIVRTILSMAHSLDLMVIAEGVESQQQLDFLRDHNCQMVQGYYFGRPVPADDLPWRLSEQSEAG